MIIFLTEIIMFYQKSQLTKTRSLGIFQLYSTIIFFTQKGTIMQYTLLGLILLCLTSLSGCFAETKSKSDKQHNQAESPIHDTAQQTVKDYTMLAPGQQLNLDEFTKTESGILYKVIQSSDQSKPHLGEQVTVHYSGWLLEKPNTVGQKFDSSRDRDQHFSFNLGYGMVIAGWEQTVADMHVGERRIIVLPPELAYGARGAGGAIPPHATLIFDVELFKSE